MSEQLAHELGYRVCNICGLWYTQEQAYRHEAAHANDLRPVTLRPSLRARLWRSIVEYVAAWRKR